MLLSDVKSLWFNHFVDSDYLSIGWEFYHVLRLLVCQCFDLTKVLLVASDAFSPPLSRLQECAPSRILLFNPNMYVSRPFLLIHSSK